MPKIACILPKGEGFSPEHAGAIALCVQDNITLSRYCAETYVIGGVTAEGFPHISYFLAPAPYWFESRSHGYARHCVRILKKNLPDLIEVHNRPLLALSIADALPDAKVIVHLHNDPQSMRGSKTIKERAYLLQQMKAIYCVSHFVRNQFMEGLSPDASAKVHVVYNGLAMPTNSTPKEKTIVFVGRMAPEKGALPLAKALAHVLPQFPDWRAVFIGSKRHVSGQILSPYEHEVLDALKPVQRQTEFTGFISHDKTMYYMARAEIAVVPSVWNEPFGRTALEALASGCALISSDHGGLQEVIGSAALVPEDITEHYLMAALHALLSDNSRRTALQQAALPQAEHFRIENTTAALDDIRATLC